MCGIAGAVGIEGLDPRPFEQSVLDALRHRGPDDFGTFAADGVWLGMRRLAIIDLETGKQPVTNEDGSVTVILNGEIYNYRELRKELASHGHAFRTSTDTEVIPHLYEDLGPDLCGRLRGMFGFAVWDSRHRQLLLGRDRFGKKPLYIARTKDGGVIFASEIKALLPMMDAIGIPLRISDQGVYDYLSLGVVPQPSTIYEGVEMVPPGHTLRWDCGGVGLREYWRPELEPKLLDHGPGLSERLRVAVGDAVDKRLRSDVPLGVFLSGGLDSTVVAVEAARRLGGDLQTFTIGVADNELDESDVASRTAEKLGVHHRVLTLDVAPINEVLRVARHYDQPFADPSAIPSLAVSRLAREHVTVILNGDGGDEIFGGYRRYWAAGAVRWIPPQPWMAGLACRVLGDSQPGRRRSISGFARRFVRGLAEPDGSRYLTWTTDFLFERDKEMFWRGGQCRSTEEWLEDTIPVPLRGVDALVLGDIRVNLLSDLLVKMDMASMASSLEARSPLLDHELAEMVLRLPERVRVRPSILKAVLREAYREELPDEVLRGPKRGFEIPLLHWIRNDFQELIHDLLLAEDARINEYLEFEFVHNVVCGKSMQDRNWPGLVYSLLILELWLRGGV